METFLKLIFNDILIYFVYSVVQLLPKNLKLGKVRKSFWFEHSKFRFCIMIYKPIWFCYLSMAIQKKNCNPRSTHGEWLSFESNQWECSLLGFFKRGFLKWFSRTFISFWSPRSSWLENCWTIWFFSHYPSIDWRLPRDFPFVNI